MTRRAALLALVLFASGCSKPHAAPTSSDGAALAAMTLALDWVPEPEFGGFYAARESGAFARRGLDVTIQGGGAGVPVVQMVASGKVQLGLAGADEVLTARARGADVIPVFATFQTSPQGIMAHASRGAKTMADVLSSGTLSLEPGLPYAAFLKKKFGFGKVSIVPYDGGVARFMVDKSFAQQCYVTSEPIAAKKRGGDPQVFLVADEGYNPYLGVVIVGRANFDAHRAEVRAFVEAAREGWKNYLANPAPTNTVLAKLNPAMDGETLAGAADAERKLIAPEGGPEIGSMTRERWETLGKQLVELGILEKAPDVGAFLLAP